MHTIVQPTVVPRPFLKWAGGKTQLIQQYIHYFPKSFKTYYEPFLGGGAVFFYLNPPSAILTDINAELVNVYRCVRDNVEELIVLLETHQSKHCKEYYYDVRQGMGITKPEKAARLIYLNKTCFNGLYRENSQGQFNVPIGKYKNLKICHPSLLRSACFALQNTQIHVKHFERSACFALQNTQIHVKHFEYILDYADSCDDFVYFDPPYYPISPTSNFTAYSRYAFSQDDQIKRKEIFAELAQRGVKVMLSNSDCNFIRELYCDFQIHSISATRLINSKASKRGKIPEVLITSY